MKERNVIIAIAGVCVLTLLCGCQVLQSGPSDEKLVKKTMADWKAAMLAKDIESLMATYSDGYVSSRGDGKDSVRQFMSRAIEQGYMDNVKIGLDAAKITVEDNKANIAPVEFSSDRGTMTLEYTLEKADGKWLIVGSKRPER